MRSEQDAHVLPGSREVPGLGRREAAMHKAAEAHHVGLVEGHPKLALAAELPSGETLDEYRAVPRVCKLKTLMCSLSAAGVEPLGRMTERLALLLLDSLQHVEGKIWQRRSGFRDGQGLSAQRSSLPDAAAQGFNCS